MAAIVTLRQTCYSCPEQYNAYIGDKYVGYLRLRHGWFRVNLGSPSGPIIYETNGIQGDGNFTDQAERAKYLTKACHALLAMSNAAVQLFEIVDGDPDER